MPKIARDYGDILFKPRLIILQTLAQPIRHSVLCNGATIHKIMGGAERDKSGAFCHILSMFSFQSGLETLML